VETVRYRCNACSDETYPEFADFVKLIAAAASHGRASPATWWVPLDPWPTVQAEAVAWLAIRDGRCPYHAALFAELAVADMRRRGAEAATMPQAVR
jgi:hypothetical protein